MARNLINFIDEDEEVEIFEKIAPKKKDSTVRTNDKNSEIIRQQRKKKIQEQEEYQRRSNEMFQNEKPKSKYGNDIPSAY